MTQFFIGLYDYFERHKILFYLSLISCVLLMGFFAASKVRREHHTILPRHQRFSKHNQGIRQSQNQG